MNELTTASRLGRVRATAYAKLTLSLRVGNLRDDGYHEIEALAVSLNNPLDIIEAEAVPHPGGVTFEVQGDTEDVPTGMTNLAARAAEELMVRAGRSGHGVRLTLRKKIPAGAGLGGGSADAAAAMFAVRRLLDIDFNDDELSAIGAKLGSDVPFCLQGGAAWMRGRGEKVERISLHSGIPFLVAFPPFRLATPDVYRAWDDIGRPESKRKVPAPPEIADLLPELSNDLEPAAEALEPRLTEFREALAKAAEAEPLLAGSGSAYVVHVKGHDDIAGWGRVVQRRIRAMVTAATTVSRGVRLGTG
jgi:4-diphosphocytidyl-2-C-methyl-D-erythritol kinase